MGDTASRRGPGVAVYLRPRLLAVLVMGFGSGLPLALTGATLALRLADRHVSLSSIGYFSLATMSYNLKFIWAPLIDRMPVPLLTRWLGRRRSWALVMQMALVVTILGLGLVDPGEDLALTAAWAVAVAFFSATQDIVIDAYRVELLSEAEQGAGAAATQMGYRLGMILSGAGASYLADVLDWRAAYAVMAAAMLIASAAVLLTREPAVEIDTRPGEDFAGTMSRTVIAPFRDFAGRRLWPVILIFIVLYFLGDATAGHFAGPFYLSLGFTKTEIAGVSKLFGVLATVFGVSVGGVVVYRMGIFRALMVCGIAKLIMGLMYVILNIAGHDLGVLTGTIAAENISGGMASAAFVAYLSRLCSPAYTATQYALLSALATMARTTLSSGGGVLASEVGWTWFFVIAAALGLPALLLIPVLARDSRRPDPIKRESWI